MHSSDSQLLKARQVTGPANEHAPEAGRPVCLLTTCHPERGLSRALIQHLAEELPGVTFTLRATEGITAVWICGYERGAADLVSLVRSRYPDALLLVTGRGNPGEWRSEVQAAGADHAASWPIPFDELSRLLRRRRKAV